MLFHYLKNPGGNHYIEQLHLDVSGEIDLSLFEKAWNLTIQTNEMLRAVFRWEAVDNPIQIILNEFHLYPEFHDFSGKSNKEAQQSIQEIKNRERKRTFDLQREVPFRVVLCKCEKNRFQIIISNHHILYDGWSSGIILTEFLTTYTQYARLKEPGKPVKTTFKEFIKWTRDRDTGNREEFWRDYLNGYDTHADLSIKKRGNGPGNIKNVHISFTKEMKRDVEGFVKTRRTTPASLFYCAWGILLQKYNNSREVVFGTTVSGRSAKVQGIEDIVGLFINTLPLRVQTGPGETVEALLSKVDKALLRREEHETAALVDINTYSELTGQEELFDSILVIENYPLDRQLMQQKGELSVDSYEMVETTHYDLTVGISVSEEIDVSFIYNEGVFDNRDIKNMSHHFLNIIRGIVFDGMTISGIEMITPEEKDKILYEFNNTAADYPADKTIHRLFEEQVRRTPDAVALNGSYKTYKTYMTYKELNRKSDQLASRLKEKGVGPGTVAAIMRERTPELLTGILGILKAGGAYLPIDPAFPEERKQYMLKDSNAGVLVTDQLTQLTQFIQPTQPTRLTPPTQPCYVIYTSGSTGNPKGVLIEHAQLVNFVYHMYNGYNRDFSPRDRCLSLTNITFDVSVCEFFLPLSFGSCIVLLSDEEKSNVYDLAGMIVERGITFAYIPPGFLEDIDTGLRSRNSRPGLDKILVGVEPIPDSVLEDYLRLNPSMQIINGYGPTETTICATTYRYRSQNPEEETVPIGRPLSNTAILLLDRDDRPVPVGIPGEICISGAGVGRGYLNRPGLTAEKFVSLTAYPLHLTPFYKTGDLARWLQDGNIQFLGRIDHQVKIRGHRIELGEIENQLLRHPSVKKTVVIAGETGNRDKTLCAYVVPASAESLEVSGLRSYLSGRLPRYMIPSYFVRLDEIPLTPSGKVNRKALPGIEIKPGETYTAPGDDVERELAEIWGEVLSIESSHIGMDDDFFSLGGHSLKAASLISKIHKILNVKIPMDFLFENPTIVRLARYVKEVKKDRYVSIPKAEKREYYPLSGAQKRLYITGYMEEESVVYNVQNLVRLEGGFSLRKLEETFKTLIARHESFRTSFHVIDETPVQKIHETVDFALEEFPLTPYRQFLPLISHFVRPFDLARPPLLRAGLLKTGEGNFILMTDIHHIIADGVSMGVFVKEFAALYRGEELPPLRIQYKDFSLWRREIDESPGGREAMGRQEAFWLKEFEGEVPRLNLPLDFTRPPILEYDGAVVVFELDGESAALLKKTALEEDATLFTVLLAIVYVLLNKMCDLDDVVVGTPVSGRGHADLEKVMGLFVNMLVLRNRPTADKTFRDFLKEVKGKTLSALDNRDYPYEELVDTLAVTRDPGRNPLFDVLFVWEDPDIELGHITPPGSASGELKLTPYKVEKTKAMFDIILTSTELGGKMTFSINYRTSLFKRETIESMSMNFKEVLSAVIKNPGSKLGDITISHDLLAAGSQSLLDDRGDFGF